MPQETNDFARYNERDLIIAIAQGMGRQQDSIAVLRDDMVKGFDHLSAQMTTRMDKLESRVDEIEKKQDKLEGAVDLARWLIVLTVGGPILGIVVGLILGR